MGVESPAPDPPTTAFTTPSDSLDIAPYHPLFCLCPPTEPQPPQTHRTRHRASDEMPRQNKEGSSRDAHDASLAPEPKALPLPFQRNAHSTGNRVRIDT